MLMEKDLEKIEKAKTTKELIELLYGGWFTKHCRELKKALSGALKEALEDAKTKKQK